MTRTQVNNIPIYNNLTRRNLTQFDSKFLNQLLIQYIHFWINQFEICRLLDDSINNKLSNLKGNRKHG